MFNLIYKIFTNICTKKKTQIPLFCVTFDYNKYKANEIKNCMAHIHPLLRDDLEVQNKINELIDMIRNKYDMEDIP